ncbi:hypothetical protein ACQJ6K_01810 [Helicobacter pylori]
MAIRFGVIFIDNNIDNFFNDRRKTKQQLIRSILERKSGLDFIRFIEATASYTNLERKRKLSFEECAVFYTDADFVRIEREITSFLVFQNDRSVTLNNDPSATFNLKNYLLVLAKKFYCSVCYCENINTQKIEWISTNHSDFGEILHEFSDITSYELPQFLTDLKDKIIEFNFHKKIINNSLPFGIIFIVSDPENLLKLKKELGFEPSGIFYCENASTHKIELISNEPKDFKGVLLEFLQITSLSPNELPQFLANFKFSKSTYGIDKAEFSLSSLSLENMTFIDNLSTLKRNIKNTFDRYSWHGYSKIPQEKRITQIKKQVSEECKVNPFFHSWRVSSEQNRKVNKIAEDLKSGKIVGEKIIDNVFDINASYCFITPEDLKNLKERLFIQQDIDITHVINQKKGEAFDHILINDIKYNLLDNTFHFIFNVGNSLLKESSQLIIEVPREALDLENVDRLIENTLSSHRVCFCSEIHSVCSENSLICHLNQGSYIIDLHLIDD